jgi:RNA-directed DNA polymerase
MTNDNLLLVMHGDHAIRRHIKVKGFKSLYDGDWVYWVSRLSKVPGKSPRVIKLLKKQQNRCKCCKLWFRSDDLLEVHHQDQNRNNNDFKNLSLLHSHCHDYVHRKCA